MSRLVKCKKYGVDMPGLDLPPYPGPKGEEIFKTVSKKAEFSAFFPYELTEKIHVDVHW